MIPRILFFSSNSHIVSNTIRSNSIDTYWVLNFYFGTARHIVLLQLCSSVIIDIMYCVTNENEFTRTEFWTTRVFIFILIFLACITYKRCSRLYNHTSSLSYSRKYRSYEIFDKTIKIPVVYKPFGFFFSSEEDIYIYIYSYYVFFRTRGTTSIGFSIPLRRWPNQ